MKERIAAISTRWRRAKRRTRSLIRNVCPIADTLRLPRTALIRVTGRCGGDLCKVFVAVTFASPAANRVSGALMRLKRDERGLIRHRALAFRFGHDLFGKPLHTFPD